MCIICFPPLYSSFIGTRDRSDVTVSNPALPSSPERGHVPLVADTLVSGDNLQHQVMPPVVAVALPGLFSSR